MVVCDEEEEYCWTCYQLGRKQPLDGGRIGVPTDLDGAALLLLGDGGRFVTGQVLRVDGGWSVSGT